MQSWDQLTIGAMQVGRRGGGRVLRVRFLLRAPAGCIIHGCRRNTGSNTLGQTLQVIALEDLLA